MVPRPAQPTKEIFDPFNSSATGHQRAENRLGGSTAWRDSRTLKLHEQFRTGAGGGKRMSDTVGAGSLDFGVDGRTATGGWEKGAKGLRTGGQRSIWDCMQGAKVEKDVERPAKRAKVGDAEDRKPTKIVNPFTPFVKENGSVRESSWTSHETTQQHLLSPVDLNIPLYSLDSTAPGEEENAEQVDQSRPQIFTNLTFYVNGSTAPLISDHKLKHEINVHGGRTSIGLGRRSVTHVIIGRTAEKGGAGGGLAGSKIQKEVTQRRGEKVKFVNVEWVVESIKAGRRLPESRFETMRMAPKGVGSVMRLFKQGNKSDATRDDNG